MDKTLQLCSSLHKLYKERREQRLSCFFSVFRMFLLGPHAGVQFGGLVMHHVALKRTVFLLTSQSFPCILTTSQAYQIKPNCRPYKAKHQYTHKRKSSFIKCNIPWVPLCIYPPITQAVAAYLPTTFKSSWTDPSRHIRTSAHPHILRILHK